MSPAFGSAGGDCPPPVLDAGAHHGPQDGMCVMEAVSVVAGLPWTDSPACTNPTLALAAQLTNNNTPANRIHTAAKVHLEKLESGFAITRIELATEAEVPNIDDAKFQELAATAKAGCPVSKALAGTEIHLNATLL